MDDWGLSFTPDMIDGSRRIVVNCQTADDALSCAEVLDEIGILYGDGESPIKKVGRRYAEYKESFCFYIDGLRLYYGPNSSTYDKPWSSYEKCTFNGVNVTDISDSSFDNIIGGGK